MPLMAVVPETVMLDARVVAPVLWVRFANDSPAAMVTVPVAAKMTVEVPGFHTWLAAVEVQEPFTVTVEPLAVSVPRTPRTTPATATGGFAAPVVRTTLPVGAPAVF